MNPLEKYHLWFGPANKKDHIWKIPKASISSKIPRIIPWIKEALRNFLYVYTTTTCSQILQRILVAFQILKNCYKGPSIKEAYNCQEKNYVCLSQLGHTIVSIKNSVFFWWFNQKILLLIHVCFIHVEFQIQWHPVIAFFLMVFSHPTIRRGA
jgi:hypothetical protein